jgi:transposase-like protein
MTKRGTKERNARYLWRCRACGRQYTVRVGTIMEDSAIPLRHWVFALWSACASKKGVSALQIKRQTGVTYKSALFMMHRIRWAMSDQGPRPLVGTVEVDETYVGGKPRPPHKGRPRIPQHGTKKDRFTPVIAMVERQGSVRTRVTTDVTAKTMPQIVKEEVAKSARIYTDGASTYDRVGRYFEGGHERVKHTNREYVRGDVHTNTVEGFFSLLKRGVIGTFHHVSRKHLHRYVSEFEFRWNTRRLDDGQRLSKLVQCTDGRRLTYAEQVR